MQINESQAKLLHNLYWEIKDQLHVNIGYSSLFGSFVDDEDNFVIFEEGKVVFDKGYPDADIKAFHLIHKLDFSQEHFGIMVAERPNEFSLRDDECQQFMKDLFVSLEDGTLTTNPTYSKEFGSHTVSVTKLANNRWEIDVVHDGWKCGMVRDFDEISKDDNGDMILETIREMEVENG